MNQVFFLIYSISVSMKRGIMESYSLHIVIPLWLKGLYHFDTKLLQCFFSLQWWKSWLTIKKLKLLNCLPIPTNNFNLNPASFELSICVKFPLGSLVSSYWQKRCWYWLNKLSLGAAHLLLGGINILVLCFRMILTILMNHLTSKMLFWCLHNFTD